MKQAGLSIVLLGGIYIVLLLIVRRIVKQPPGVYHIYHETVSVPPEWISEDNKFWWDE